jgi:Arc/MetJ family transcription regulator
MSRTNIDLDDELLRRVMKRYGVHTKTEAVDLALRQAGGQPMTIAEALAMRGAHAIDDVEDVAPL